MRNWLSSKLLALWAVAFHKRPPPVYRHCPVDEIPSVDLLKILARRYDTMIAAGCGSPGHPSEVDVLISGKEVGALADLLAFTNMATVKACNDGLHGQEYDMR